MKAGLLAAAAAAAAAAAIVALGVPGASAQECVNGYRTLPNQVIVRCNSSDGAYHAPRPYYDGPSYDTPVYPRPYGYDYSDDGPYYAAPRYYGVPFFTGSIIIGDGGYRHRDYHHNRRHRGSRCWMGDDDHPGFC